MKGRSTKNIFKESFRMAVDSIKQNKLRSILTLLGISIGVFSVIGVMTAIGTLESSINSGLNVFGVNTFSIQKWPEIMMGDDWKKYRNRKDIDYREFKEFKSRAKLPLLISVGAGGSIRNIKYKDKVVKQSVELYGADEGTVRTLNTTLADGRNFSVDDVQYSRNVCVLGMDIVDQLFPFEDPIGKTIRIKGLNYRVIGITERKGEAFGESKDNHVAIPVTSYLERFSKPWTTLSIFVEAKSENDYSKTKDEAIGIMRAVRKVQPGQKNDFEVVTNAEMIDQLSGFTFGVKLFALGISFIALLVAGIGIMNIMLVSVTERIKEIGIRKAIGATKSDILVQFLMEAVFLSEFGGVFGIILGIVGGNVVALIFNIPAVIPFDWALIGLLVCSIIGIGFGSYPAWKAAQLDPIESLRFE